MFHWLIMTFDQNSRRVPHIIIIFVGNSPCASWNFTILDGLSQMQFFFLPWTPLLFSPPLMRSKRDPTPRIGPETDARKEYNVFMTIWAWETSLYFAARRPLVSMMPKGHRLEYRGMNASVRTLHMTNAADAIMQYVSSNFSGRSLGTRVRRGRQADLPQVSYSGPI